MNRMFKNILYIVLIFTFSILQANETIKINLTQKEKAFIKNNPTLKVGLYPIEPYIFEQNDLVQGYFIDILEETFSNIGITPKLQKIVPLRQNLENFKNKKIDIALGIIKNSERAKYASFSDTKFELQIGIYAKNSNNKVISEESINGKIIASYHGYAFNPFFKKNYPDSKIVYGKDVNDMFRLVALDKADLCIQEVGSAQYTLLKSNFINLEKKNYLNLKIEASIFSVQKDKLVLKSLLEKSYNSISLSNLKKYRKKWFGETKNEDLVLTQAEKEYLQKNNIFNVCDRYDRYPVTGNKDGKLIGIMGSIYSEIEKKLGVEFKAIDVTLVKDLKEKVISNQCDFISRIPYEQEIFKHIRTTNPINVMHLVTLGNIQSSFIDDVSIEKSEKQFIVKFPAIKKHFEKAYPNIKITLEQNLDNIMHLLEENKNIYYVEQRTIAEYTVQKYGLDKFKINGILSKTKIKPAIGVNTNNHPMMVSIMNKALKLIGQDFINKIIQQYSLKEYKIEKTNYTLVYWILSLSIFVISVALFRQLTLRQMNKKLKIKVDEKTKDLQISNEKLQKAVRESEELNHALEEANITLDIKIKEEVEKNREKDKKIYESQKMVALGEMIGNIAHQWRQPLSIISTASTGVLLHKETNSLTDEILEKEMNHINDNTQYLSQTVETFRNFIRSNATKDIVKVSIQNEIKTSFKIVEATLQNNYIELIEDMEHDDIIISMPKGELSQVIVNIVNNSKDAMKERHIPEDERWIKVTLKKEEIKAIITIEDNAGGIPNEILPKIFEPYFTTKHQSQGTGLGLHMSYQIITNSLNGGIYAKNTESGAKLFIELPI